ncbi:DUF4175 domain-containing protein [Reyranella sp. CPCC 100927]|uniref:DUF4175 domain-containing protein n=1 Tax=Reyranella sp. CPCC 100927 TaxID=2599616 RepID=UPI0011B7E425|nr:DUF4175 domain-containing protein [Reyranella sp. CPCC 100927]TWT14797.1 DUF4175 domain-containing protein [Reyranella sp. CPCC 100927]
MTLRSTDSTMSMWRVFGVPLLLAVATVIGLISALLADGVWDALSWITLALPMVVAAWAIWLRRR